MGYSERTAAAPLRHRVDDLDDVIGALDISADGAVVIAAHDWGGAIAHGLGASTTSIDSPGWCCATPASPCRRGDALRRSSGWPASAGHARPRLPPHADVRRGHDRACRAIGCRRPIASAFRAPYQVGAVRAGDRRLRRRRAVRHRAIRRHAAIAAVAERLGELTVPVLLAWGAARPGVQRRLRRRPGGAAAARRSAPLPRAGHLVWPRPTSPAVVDRLIAEVSPTTPAPTHVCVRISEAPGLGIPTQRAIPGLGGGVSSAGPDDDTSAFVDVATGDELTLRRAARAGRWDRGRSGAARPANRAIASRCSCRPASTWSPPSTAVAGRRGHRGRRPWSRPARPRRGGPRRACRLGHRAPTGTAAARTLRWAPRATADRHRASCAAPRHPPEVHRCRAEPAAPTTLAAVLYTSGATGPAKGVRYRHRQLAAQRDALRPVPTASPPTTGSSPRSPRSRCTARRSASRRPSPTSTSPSPAR